MPLSEDTLGTNADGSRNEDYCIYCYKDGAFTMDCTMDEMAAHCSQFVDMYNRSTGKTLSREEYLEVLKGFFPMLKRWK